MITRTIEQVIKMNWRLVKVKLNIRNFGFAARFPTLLSHASFVNRELYPHHKVMFMQENITSGKKSEFCSVQGTSLSSRGRLVAVCSGRGEKITVTAALRVCGWIISIYWRILE